MESDVVQASYRQHAGAFDDYTQGNKKGEHAQTWLKDDNINALRIRRIYTILDPFLAQFPNTSWLTVGDGRYGLDAIYLKNKGLKALPTDISDALLKEAKQRGLIDDYRQENAEKLSFADNSFDFVFCKEAYHHFPRPAIAVYEMLRVAKKGIILLEPVDREMLPWHQGMFNQGKNMLKKLLGKPINKELFEEDGNYLYALSRRECEKYALGIGLTQVVFKGINDIYLHGLEATPHHNNPPLKRKMDKKLKFYNMMSQLGVIPYNLLFSVILKQNLNPIQKQSLQSQGYDCVDLPKNPYLKV